MSTETLSLTISCYLLKFCLLMASCEKNERYFYRVLYGILKSNCQMVLPTLLLYQLTMLHLNEMQVNVICETESLEVKLPGLIP